MREITNEILYLIKRNGFDMSNKKICAFFGHGDCPSTISDSLEKEIISAVKNDANAIFPEFSKTDGPIIPDENEVMQI